MNKRLPSLIAIAFFIICLPGCGQAPVKLLSPSEAHQNMVNILKEENSLGVVTREFDNTLWIYLPLEEEFLQFKAKKGPAAPASAKAQAAPTIHFLDGAYSGDFVIRYDIGSVKSYAKDYGYTSAFSEAYQAHQQNILSAIYRSYTNADDTPLFFVIVIADITNGLEAQTLIHFNDLKRAYTEQTFQAEYAKRVISDQPVGNPAIISDKAGKHIKFRDILMPEFVTKQIVFRVNFRYGPNSLPPTDEPKIEVLKAAAAAVDGYDFEDFGMIQLQDLSNPNRPPGSVYTVSKEELTQYSERPAGDSEGRLIHIKFQ